MCRRFSRQIVQEVRRGAGIRRRPLPKAAAPTEAAAETRVSGLFVVIILGHTPILSYSALPSAQSPECCCPSKDLHRSVHPRPSLCRKPMPCQGERILRDMHHPCQAACFLKFFIQHLRIIMTLSTLAKELRHIKWIKIIFHYCSLTALFHRNSNFSFQLKAHL